MQDERRQNKLKAGELKRETESLICAVQEQAFRTNAIKNCIDKQVVSLLCREKVESVTNIVSLSSILAGNQYQRRHDKHGKKCIGSCAENLRLNVKTNGSHINRTSYWKMENVKYFGTLQSKQIRKQNIKVQILQSLIKKRENAKSSTQLFLETKTSK